MSYGGQSNTHDRLDPHPSHTPTEHTRRTPPWARVRPRRWRRAGLRVVATAGSVLALAFAGAVSSHATPGDPPDGFEPILDAFSEVVLERMDHKSEVSGQLTQQTEPPAPYPPTGLDDFDLDTALMVISDVETGQEAFTYCIDLRTRTWPGLGYRLGDWTEANVPNLGAINFILTTSFPYIPDSPAGLTDTQRVAAVQAAIWYLSDGFVLATDVDPAIRNATAEIVKNALDNADVPEPPSPTLTITPDTLEAPVSGELVGPFTAGGTASGVIETFGGSEVFFDEAGTQPVADGTAVPSGTQLWAKYLESGELDQGFTLTAAAEVPRGKVFLYDGSNPKVTDAQKLILALASDLSLRTGATITPYPAATLEIHKTISWSGNPAHLDAITVRADCTPAPAAGITTSATLPPGAEPGTHILTLGGLRAGSTCTIVEVATGETDSVTLLRSTIAPDVVELAASGPTVVQVDNHYEQETKVIPATGAPHGPESGMALLAVGTALIVGAAAWRRATRVRA